MRFSDSLIRAAIREASNGFTSKLVAKKMQDQMIIERCSESDVANMRLCVDLKFKQNADVRKQIQETSDALIVEDVTARGAKGTNLFWGAMKTDNDQDGTMGWVGENKLGVIWMDIRTHYGISQT
jgi:predicted NAD-dependent protein-ADP-ribosyltransferase YbiA (DUF1768 family)